MPGVGTKAIYIYINHNTTSRKKKNYKLNIPHTESDIFLPFIETYTKADTLPMVPRL